ncbi:LysE family translocator [Candidatus Pristimantibacillus sp. PTI5]|uniref:LysE family translocator n=1 Tax=Candidatus Pristimantibacillus sp. PTI5 TaxID=3400422 RepID=UPI003B015A8B
MNLLFGYVFLGLSLSAPIGPINAAQLNAGIRRGFWHAWLLGLGALIADIIYMLVVFMGSVHLVKIPFVQVFLWLFGSFILIYTGIESLKSSRIPVSEFRKQKEETYMKAFLSGFLLALSNPMSILFWLGIYGSVLADTATKYDLKHLIIYSCAIISGILIWDVTMAGIASYARKWLTDRVLKSISILSGLSLVIFGIHFGYKGIQFLFT